MDSEHSSYSLHKNQASCGARVLFFSGGSALRETSRALTAHTHNSVHLITTFDSGGSSATLRQYFNMPALGDIRSRIMALANLDYEGVEAIQALFSYRLPKEAPEYVVQAQWQQFVAGTHPLLQNISCDAAQLLHARLAWLAPQLPQGFPLQGASIGNLLLGAGYLQNKGQLTQVIQEYASMVHVLGEVYPITETPAHLAVRFEDNTVLVGQHLFTGKNSTIISSPIKHIWLTASSAEHEAIELTVREDIVQQIHKADALFFPIGSFYSSIVANLLPKGVGRAICKAGCPKVFIPNLGNDPELLGHTLQAQIQVLLATLLADAKGALPHEMLTTILVDKKRGHYLGGIPETWLAKQGIHVTHCSLVSDKSTPLADPYLLAQAIIQQAG